MSAAARVSVQSGLDAVHLHIKDFTIRQLSSEWRIKSGRQVGEAAEFFAVTEAGEPVEKPGYYINRSSKGGPSEALTLDLSSRGLALQFNPSTYLHPWQLSFDLEPAYAMAKSKLQELEIDCDLQTARVSRLDLARQASMRLPTATLTPVYSILQGKRLRKVQYPGEGCSFGNKQRAAVFYDKGLQLALLKSELIQDCPPPSNLLRLEARWLKQESCGKGAGVGTFADLLSATSEGLLSRYRSFVKADVFKLTEADLQYSIPFDFESEAALLSSYLQREGGLKAYLLAISATELLKRWGGSFDSFLLALQQSGYSQRQCYRIVANLRQSVRERAFIDAALPDDRADFVSRSLSELENTFAA
jgi:hypothetical protein